MPILRILKFWGYASPSWAPVHDMSNTKKETPFAVVAYYKRAADTLHPKQLGKPKADSWCFQWWRLAYHPTIGQLGRYKSLALSGTWWSINGSTALTRGPQCVNSYWLHCGPLRMPETVIICFSDYFIDILTTQPLILIDPGTYVVTANTITSLYPK